MGSHTWFSRGHQPDGTYNAALANPDNEERIKLKSLVAFGEYTREHHGRELWFWIDYLSIHQESIQPGIRSLPLYVTSCSSLVVCYSESYETRAWTLLEQCLFTAISTKPALTAISCDGSFFPNMRPNTGGEESRKVLLNPTTGILSDESDRATIQLLVQTSEELWAKGWIESPAYWSGEEPTYNARGNPKYGPGLHGMHKVAWEETEVMVRRLQLTPEGHIRVLVRDAKSGLETLRIK